MKNLVFTLLHFISLLPVFAQNTNFRLVVYDKMNRQPIAGATVKLQETGSLRQFQAFAGEDGVAVFPLNPAERYRLEVSYRDDGTGTGYLNYTYMLSAKEINAKRTFAVELEKVKHEETGLVPAIHFKYNSPTLSEENQAALNNVVTMLKSFPSLRIEIGVYADCHENVLLVSRRAAAIIEYLAAKGETGHAIVKEYGNVRALNACNCTSDKVVCTEEKYAENRRAEFKVVAF